MSAIRGLPGKPRWPFSFNPMKIKPSKTSIEIANGLTEVGFSTKVLVDKEGDPLLVYAWKRDIVVSRIDLANLPKKNQ